MFIDHVLRSCPRLPPLARPGWYFQRPRRLWTPLTREKWQCGVQRWSHHRQARALRGPRASAHSLPHRLTRQPMSNSAPSRRAPFCWIIAPPPHAPYPPPTLACVAPMRTETICMQSGLAKPRPHLPTLRNAHAQHRTQARALAALQIKMTPVVKSSSPHAMADGSEPAPPPPSRRASSPAAAPPSAASLHLLTAAAAAEGREAAMDTEEEKEVRDRGDGAAATVHSPLLQPCLPAFPRRQAKRTGCMLACPRSTLPAPMGRRLPQCP